MPSDVIIDASMPAMIRTSGKMWDANGELKDAKAVIPDSSYAGVYSATIDFCKKNGAFDPSTMGTVPNVGLMAQKAEEYGSHDKTFEIPENGIVQVIDSNKNVLIEHLCSDDSINDLDINIPDRHDQRVAESLAGFSKSCIKIPFNLRFCLEELENTKQKNTEANHDGDSNIYFNCQR